MIKVTDQIELEEKEIQLDFVQSSGPGGQNVNKVATAAQLRFDVINSSSLPGDVRDRLIRLAANRLTNEGVLLIEAKQFRTQEQNRADAIDRLVALIQQAAHPPKPRKRTRPTLASKTRRLDSKHRHGEIKKMRRGGPGGEE